MRKNIYTLLFLAFLTPLFVSAQQQYELNSGWQCRQISKVKVSGEQLSQATFNTNQWLPATVPGTVLTTLLNNHLISDPFYGMNNKQIPDIYNTGNGYYTYWFVKDFNENRPKVDERVFLNLRGVNYRCEVYLNGHKLTARPHEGMFLRQSYNITSFLNAGKNRLAVLVYPPTVPGNPNGGQGGDGTIAKNVSLQYTAGWDWIQPIHDRNTGIWDKVTIQHTGLVRINNPHVITVVDGVRQVEGPQAPATLKATAELENTSARAVKGILKYTVDGHMVSKSITLAANTTTEVSLSDLVLPQPKLWWPNGYGPQNLYATHLQFLISGKQSDENQVEVGVRQLSTQWNPVTRSRQILVNGQKIFIKGGNWIISDAMLRLSVARYDAEVRYHKDMNLNLIRVWGGALIERPEFYTACDKYGLLVFQDFWMSGDCDGRWTDPMKKDDQWTRRKYPDDHKLYLASAIDQIKLIRNHPSLAIWCGGNEITPPEDILVPLRDSIMPKLDGTRWFIDYSNSAEMSYNSIGGNGDGPYGIQPIERFWQEKTFPFNSEVGSVGVGDYESLARFIPTANLTVPKFNDHHETVDSVWAYHKYIGYNQFIKPYGEPKDVADFAEKAQLLNYDQYRGLIEGFSSHMWDWYTGVIIWKTQNPWTALRGQMYDYYLDPNACLYGLRSGSEPVHIMYNPADGMLTAVNNTFKTRNSIMLVAKAFDMSGRDSLLTQTFIMVGPSSIQKISSLKNAVDALRRKEGVFLQLQLLDANKHEVSNNIYWLPDENDNYSGLQHMHKANLSVTASQNNTGRITVKLKSSAGNAVAFFNRISLIDPDTKKRILPAFATDNYISVMPGETREVSIQVPQLPKGSHTAIIIKGWNVDEQEVAVQ